MSPSPADIVFPPRITGPFRVSFGGSLVVHLLAFVLWTSAPPSGMPGGAVLQVTLITGDLAKRGSVPGQEVKPAEPAFAALEQVSDQVIEVDKDTEPDPMVSVARKILAAAVSESPTVRTEPAEKRQDVHEPEDRSPPEPEPGIRAALRKSPVKQTRREERAEVKKEKQPQHVAVAGSSSDKVEAEKLQSSGASPAEGERGGVGGASYQALQAALHRALLPRLDYPMLARRRGWEGRVRIGLIVEPDGDLKGVHVVESSGFKVLDRAAVKDLKEVGTLTAVESWLGDEEMDVTLPVHYRLR